MAFVRGVVVLLGLGRIMQWAEKAQRAFNRWKGWDGKWGKCDFWKRNFVCIMWDVSNWNLMDHWLFDLYSFHYWDVLDDFVRLWNLNCLDYGNFFNNFNFLDDFNWYFNVSDNFDFFDNFLNNRNVLDHFDFFNNFDCKIKCQNCLTFQTVCFHLSTWHMNCLNYLNWFDDLNFLNDWHMFHDFYNLRVLLVRHGNLINSY